MIYAVSYEIDGLLNPGGLISTSQADVIDRCKSLVENSLSIFGDVLDGEWLDLDEQPANPTVIFQIGSIEEKLNILSQVSDEMKSQKYGYIDYWEYSDIFDLIKDQNTLAWCSDSMKDRIKLLRKEYFDLLVDLSDEWE
jgi:uncharacterized protein YfkK (UPF0435 family)